MSCTRELHDCCCHTSDRACSSDQHILPSASKESAVCVAFPNGSKIAYISSGMFGLHGHTLLDGITRYSANAPLRFTPTPFASLQFSLCPSRQLRHFPHVICPSPDTRSPILNPCTPVPTSTTSPTYSCPAVSPIGIVCCAHSFHW